MSDRMSDERLAELDQRITNSCDDGYDCNCDNAPCGLEPSEAREMLAEMKRLRELESSLTREWGYRPPRTRISATLAGGEKWARDAAERRGEVVAFRLRTDWVNEGS